MASENIHATSVFLYKSCYCEILPNFTTNVIKLTNSKNDMDMVPIHKEGDEEKYLGMVDHVEAAEF